MSCLRQVLSNEAKRSVYDVYGRQGLEAGLSIVPHSTLRRNWERFQEQEVITDQHKPDIECDIMSACAPAGSEADVMADLPMQRQLCTALAQQGVLCSAELCDENQAHICMRIDAVYSCNMCATCGVTVPVRHDRLSCAGEHAQAVCTMCSPRCGRQNIRMLVGQCMSRCSIP